MKQALGARRAICAGLLALAACGDHALLGPQTVRVLALESPTSYALQDKELRTLRHVRRITGDVARLRGGGALFIEEALLSGELTAESADDVQQASLIDGAAAVHAQFEQTPHGLIPTDWESLLMFTFYHHMEHGFAFYENAGVQAAELAPFDSYFNARFSLLVGWGTSIINDNAAYAPMADGLLLFPSGVLDQGIPLCANEGVVAHELSHGFKHRIIHHAQGSESLVYAHWDNVVAINSYRADDEGLADFMGAVHTGDPNFIAQSLPGLNLNRDVSVRRDFTYALYCGLNVGVASYNPYSLGSALASWLWATANNDPILQQQLARVVIAALYDLAPTLDSNYRITALLNAIMLRALPDMRSRGCALLRERLNPLFGPVPTCDL